MNILNEEIGHITFGRGKVISQDADAFSVQFPEPYGSKKFVYPDAFERYLQLYNPDAASSVLAELKAKRAKLEAERIRKCEEYDATAKMRKLEKIALKEPKKKSPAKK